MKILLEKILDKASIPVAMGLGIAAGSLGQFREGEIFLLVGSTFPIITLSLNRAYEVYSKEKDVKKALAVGATETMNLAGYMFTGYIGSKILS